MSVHVAIPSATAANLIACVGALRWHEPDLPPADIIVVDDGAKFGAAAHLPGVTWISGARPFNFARNINLGFDHVPGDAFLLNDDACLLTPGGFSTLAKAVTADARIALCSAGVHSLAGDNPNQNLRGDGQMRHEPRRLVFVCVVLPGVRRRLVGPLDEQFTGYAFEYDDYSCRVLQSGATLAVFDGCSVDHAGDLPPTFRRRGDYNALVAHNQALFAKKCACGRSAPVCPPHLIGRACGISPSTIPRAWNCIARTPAALNWRGCWRVRRRGSYSNEHSLRRGLRQRGPSGRRTALNGG